MLKKSNEGFNRPMTFYAAVMQVAELIVFQPFIEVNLMSLISKLKSKSICKINLG
jgi:hypothetical protein